MHVLMGFLPVVILASALLLGKFNGRKELMRLDLVQFIFSFVITPLGFIWLKTFLFQNLKPEIGVLLDLEDWFFIDTLISSIYLYVFAFIVIHSLTKTFQLKKAKDPMYDIFEHAEHFHWWITHFGVWSFSMVLCVMLSGVNLLVPFDTTLVKGTLVPSVLVGVIVGLIGYVGIWLYVPAKTDKFNRLVRLEVGMLTIVNVLAYFSFRPAFSSKYSLFWAIFFLFATMAVASQLLTKFSRMQSIVLMFKSETDKLDDARRNELSGL